MNRSVDPPHEAAEARTDAAPAPHEPQEAIAALESVVAALRQWESQHTAGAESLRAQAQDLDRRAAGIRNQAEATARQRQLLEEVEQCLATSEVAMLRRWAAHRATVLTTSITAAVAALVVASFLLGRVAVAPTWYATAQLTIGSLADETIPTEQWLRHQRTALYEQDVLVEAINQMGQRGTAAFTAHEALRQAMARSLTLSTTGPPVLELAFTTVGRGPDRDRAVALLEGLCRARVGVQIARLAGVTDPTTAVRITRSPACDAAPRRGEQWSASGITFGAACLCTLLAWTCARWWLGRSPRIMHETGAFNDVGSAQPEASVGGDTGEKTWP